MTNKRKDKSRVVLRTGELQRSNGTYQYSWTDANKKRRYIYAKSLEELRAKEEQIAKQIQYSAEKTLLPELNE